MHTHLSYTLMANPTTFISVLFLHAAFVFSSAQHPNANMSVIETSIRDRAFELLRRTSQVVHLALPASLSGEVEASALRIRSSALWADGANVTAFRIPPRVVPGPYARRVTIVFEYFRGNSCKSFFTIPDGYALAAPVVGLLAYDASGTADGGLNLETLGEAIRIEFRSLSSNKVFNASMARCLTFGSSGRVVATHSMASASACAVTGTGHFAVAMPVAEHIREPPTPVSAAAVRERWWEWVLGIGGGVVGLGLVGLVGSGAVRWARRRRREGMEAEAAAGEELDKVWVRGSKMPSAKMVRTGPSIEERSI